MENVTRTIYAAYLQTVQLLKLPFVLTPKTTLNEALNILATTEPQSTDMPIMKYLAIGNGGHTMKMGANGVSIPEPIQHRPSDANLFNQLPFVLRTAANDLTISQQANYALRTTVTYNGTSYIAYYLKRIDLSAVSATMNYNAVASGVTTTTSFVPNTTNLNPTPPALNSSGVNIVTGDYLTASALLSIPLTSFDVSELLNVANIIYGSPDYAIISEMALVSGIDKVISVVNGSTTYNFNEVFAAQVATFFSSFHSMQFSTSGLTLSFDVGATEPMGVI